MSCTPAVTHCDGPSCEATHEEGRYHLAEGWIQLNGELGQLDFCGLPCLAEWINAKLADSTGNAPPPLDPPSAEEARALEQAQKEHAERALREGAAIDGFRWATGEKGSTRA